MPYSVYLLESNQLLSKEIKGTKLTLPFLPPDKREGEVKRPFRTTDNDCN